MTNVSGDISRLQTFLQDNTTFLLEILGTQLTVRPSLGQQQSGQTAWSASVSGATPADDGHAIFTLQDRGVAAQIATGERGYRIVTTGDQIHRLTEINISKLPDEAPPVIDGREPKPTQEIPRAEDQTIDLLLLYSKALLDQLKKEGISLEAFIAQRQKLLDDVYLNGQNKLGVNVRIAHHEQYTGSLSKIPKTQLSRLATDKGVAKRRNEVKADLVALVVPLLQGACGIGKLYTGAASEAFSVTQYNCEFKFTVAHEVGHNLGANRARQDIKNPSKLRCNFGFKSPTAHARTLMAYACKTTSCPRKPFFSDVSLKIGNIEMGVACDKKGAAQNVVTVRARAPVVAKFR